MFKVVFRYEKRTPRKFRYKQALPAHDDLIHDGECPYLYLDKTFVREQLGNANIITVTFEEGV